MIDSPEAILIPVKKHTPDSVPPPVEHPPSLEKSLGSAIRELRQRLKRFFQCAHVGTMRGAAALTAHIPHNDMANYHGSTIK